MPDVTDDPHHNSKPRSSSAIPGAALCRALEEEWFMVVVARLLTFVDIDEAVGVDARSWWVSARHEAVLADGRRVVLLADRGWGGGGSFVLWGGEPSEEDLRLVEPLDSWAYQTEWEMKQTARVVVGPDEPFEGRTHADMEAAHWESLTRILREQGVEVEPAELEALPHDVELSDRVLARIGRGGLPQG